MIQHATIFRLCKREKKGKRKGTEQLAREKRTIYELLSSGKEMTIVYKKAGVRAGLHVRSKRKLELLTDATLDN